MTAEAPDGAPGLDTQPIDVPALIQQEVAAETARTGSTPASETKRDSLKAILGASIFALGFMTVVSIGALFLNSAAGLGGRLFAMLLLFATFVGLTALDQNLSLKRNWYALGAIISNIWLLSMSLIVIWFTEESFYFGTFLVVILPVTLIVLLTRFALLASLLLLDKTGPVEKLDKEGSVEKSVRSIVSVMAVWSLAVSTMLFTSLIAIRTAFKVWIEIALNDALNDGTLYLGTEHRFDGFWDVWAKLGTAALIIAAMAASISLLLAWQVSAERRKLLEESSASGRVSVVAKTRRARTYTPSQVPAATPPQSADSTPWPVLPNGQPYPATKEGDPDFAEAGRIVARLGSG